MRDDIPEALVAQGFTVQERDPYSFYLGCVQAVMSQRGEFIGVASLVMDISEQIEAEAAVRSSETKYRALVEQSLAGVYMISGNEFLYVNPMFAEIFGYRPEELVSDCRVDDLIQWTPGASGIWRPHNIGRALLTGLEAEVGGSIPLPAGHALDVNASGTWLHSEDRTGEANADGRELPYRPRFTGAVSAILAVSGGELETVWRAVDDAWITRANTKVVPGHVRGDLLFRRPVGAGLRLDAGITNLTVEIVRDFRDYPLPGRAFVAGITWERTMR